MNHYEVKFLLDFDNYDYSIIEYIFSNVRNALNWQFDENFNANLIDEDINYQVRDVSNLEMDEIDKIIDSFFRFNFDYIINVPLYKFLVLKNNKGLKILANISSLIFDYSSINDFHALFVDLNKSYPKRDLEIYYSGVKDYLDSPNFKKDSQYWTKHITNSSSYVNFYNLKNNACNSQIINVDNDSVSTFIENHDCSLFDFYGCAFSLYLSRINRIGGSLLKTIIPGKKTDSEVFDKSTLLKIDVNNDDSFSVLLNGFRSEFENALNHAAVDVENYLDENASFYSIYDFNDFDENIRVYAGEYSALTLNIYGNSLELVYNSELFSEVYAEHMARNIECLINNVLSSPDQAISSVDILSDEEKALLSDYCSGKTIEVEKDKLFSEAFREHALANPDAIAVDDGINQVSYGELEKSSNSIANDLYENHNIGPGSRVALMLPRDYHFPELVLALNKIGAAYVPIDLLFPVNRIEHMLNISETEHLITKGTIAESLDLNVNIISIEDLNRNKDVDVEIISKIDDLFAILFTSGTTGIPKGVMFHNRQFPWFYAAYGDMFNVSPGDVIGLYASFSFVASFLINASMFWGGCIRLFNENEQKNSLLLTKALKETHINSLILPPTLGIPIFENEDLKLDYLILAGAKLNELSEKDRHTKLVNFYGTTEVIFAITKIYDLNDIEDDRVPVGRPIANTWTYILDENGNQMPIGVPGEICISSPAITQGYYNNPQSTSKVYVDNPYCDSEINKRMYRTGDIGFYNFDGEIEIIGREDDQLSVRGFRIESDEILTIMKSFEEISNIYLDVDNDNLIAYYTTIDDLDINEVKDALKTELPYYMIPSVFIELEKIPLNTNGKIDKSSLRVVTNNENIEITDEVISCVVDAFKEVLNQDVVLIDDDFVSLGGNSLSAMKLQLLLNERLDVSLSSNELIGLSTPQEIANHIRFNLNVRSTVDEEKYTFDEHCPLSESQLNVYLDESVNDMGTAYNNPFKIDFKDNYSAGEIKDALIKLFEAFPILKARVLNDGGVLSFAFDAEPEIIEGSLNDMHSFVRKFEFDKCLSRFLVADEGTSIILCADFHHLIFDGTSLNILLNKLASILDNEDSDFIDKGALRQIAFEEIIDSDYMDNAREFFDDMLADNNEVYGLLPSLNGTDEEFELIDTFDMDMEYLSSFLQNHSITYNQFFTSVFAYALSRFTGSDKVLFNIIEDGRGHIDLSKSVGMFVKTLPVLMDCKNQDINSYLKYSSNLINSVMKYDLYPFRILASDYDLNSNILFQYSHNLFSDVINKEDLKYSVDELEHDLNADLSFYIFNNGENRLTIRILYSSIYSKNFIEHFNQSYKLILNEMIRVGELKEIDYISNRDIELLDSYNQTKHKLAYDDILDAFNDNLSEYGDNVLVGYEDTSYTHGQGAFIANEVAGKLDELGVVKQDYVALFVNRSEWFLLASMGVLSMGGIYVPIDTSYPDERVIFMLEDTKSKAVIVDDNSAKRMKSIIAENDLNINVFNVSDIAAGNIQTSKHLSTVEVDEEDIACVLYTSGTTGVPKGVLVTRKAINNFVSWYVDETNFTSSDVYGMHCSYVFDIHTAALYSPVISGGSLYVVPEDIRLDLKALNDYYVEHGCTHTYITSQVGKLFAESGMETTIKLLCFGGMKLGELNAPDSIGPFESYGPSENLAISTSIFANKRMHHSSIGRFISNVKGYVLDKELRRVPLGAVGELYLAGSQLTPGYLNRNEENDNAFFDNPFDDKKGYERIYKTGDMVRFLPDGTLGIVGRRDSQVKVRGNRVELTEVESSIRSMENVEDVTVQTTINNGNNELVAYVVINNDLDGDELKNSICNHVNAHKPEYMVPSYVVKLDAIPLNVNGKVDKRALPDVDLTSLYADYVAPTTEDEKIIVEAFEKVFNQKIGIHDDFVHLGGDSLTAIRLLSYLGDYNITAVDILRLHTPYEIAKNIRKVEFDLDVYSLQSGCPLNESQLNVYLDMMVNNKDDAYIIPVSMEISKKYEINDIQNAINNILDVHPILSMCISDEFEVPYLVKGSKPSITVESNVDEDYIIEFANRPFDLNDSLCRFLIIDDNDDYKLFVAFNHIIFDGLSANVFKRDLQDILDGESISVDESFLKVSAFSQQMQNTDEYADAKKFYESMLTDNEETSTLMESIDSDEHGHLKIDLNLDTNLLKSFLDSHGVSENVLFTAAFAYTLSRFTGYENASFNLVENGRDRFNNFNSIGMYVNTLPVIVNCKNQDIASFMENMGSLIYDVMRYNYYPFRLLANEYNINSDILFQFMPEWIGGIGQSNDSLNNSENDIITKRNSSIADLVVEVVQFSQNYNLNIMYCGKYSKSFVEHFAESYKLILKQIINVEKLEEITYITHEDIEILDSYNQTQHPLKYEDILDAFNDNLSEYEDNVLVGYEDTSYTHGQGAFIANEVAGKLDELGVVKQDYVALFVNRSEWFLLASMGVLSMGGIYVPIDTSYPDERVIFMLEDTKSKAVIVDDNSAKRMKSIIAENDLNINVFNVSDIAAGNIQTSKHLSTVEVDEEDIACVLYTSGTTGVPKGVLVTRKAINNFVSWYVDETNFTSSDVYGMHCSYVFDIHTAALYSPVISGGSLYVVPEDIRLDLKALNDYYVEHGCTHTYITSQVGKLFAESGMETTIKLLCFGGMKLGELNAPDSIGPFESYGPSENLAISTSIFANKRMHHSSIGRFISNVKGYVLDKELRRVPLGAVGELYLAGSQLTPGYLNRNEENDNAFFDNPFDDKKGYERIYKTGDMVRFLPDGTLGIVGRRDSQVKVRGNRVELTEVESSIRSMENVEDVTVQTTINNGNNELVAYVVINNDLDGDELKNSICNHVNAHKPEYMVPSYVVKLDAIPLNVNGKVDKRALPEIDKTSLQVEYVAPRNENEKEIVEAFKKALNLKKVGIYDDFIRLGGDSLTAIRLLSYIESNDITMADIFTFRTPEAIAKNMTDFSFDLDIYSLESGCPLNAAQLNVFGDVILYNKKDAYHIPGYIAISKKYCLEDILNALNELLNAHPILSMHLSDIYEVNDADDTGNLDAIIDLIKIAKKLGIKKIMNLINKYGLKDVSGIYNMIKTVIRLLKGEYPYLVKGDKPPISVKSKDDNDTIIEFLAESMDIFNNLSKFMIVETEESYYLFYLIHHIIFDATSAGVFKHDFEILLDGGSVDFDDAFLKSSAYTHQIKSTEKFDEASEYYYPILTSLDDVGTLLEDDSSEGYSTSTWDLKFDKMVFKSFLNNAGISENVLFTSVFAYALAQFVDGDKVLFTMIENGRDRFNENFIGMTSNVMPLVADCKDRSINSFMKDMADAVYGISRHSYYPIVLLYQKYDFEVNILFQFVPNWIADDFNNVEGIDDIGSEEIMNHILNFHGDQITEFFVQIYQNGENYRLIITNSNKYSNNLIEDFKETYTSILSNIINANLHSNLNTTLK